MAGGLGGALLGLLVSTVLYLTLSLCIAEMSAHTLKIGGSHTFVGESPLGRLGAYLCGVAELLKIIPTGSVCVFAIASYVGHAVAGVLGSQKVVEVGIWFVSYGVFTLLNLMGVEMSVNFQVISPARGRASITGGVPLVWRSLNLYLTPPLPSSFRWPPPSRASLCSSPSTCPVSPS